MQRRVMNYRTFSCAAALLLPLCGPSFARCSLNAVRGAWAWQSHGTAMVEIPGSPTPVPVPFASLGIMDVDRLGRYTASATISVGGQVQEIEFPGSIQVNADCTATGTYTIGPVEGADQLVILDNGNEMHVMPTKHPLGPVAGRGIFRRIARGNPEPRCTGDMVRGVYGGTGEGTMMIPVAGQPQPVPAPFSGIFAMTFQGRGTGAGAATASLGGSVFDLEFPAMSMEVNPDCTATLEWTAVSRQIPGQTFTGAVKYIVLDNGDELVGMKITDSIGLPIEVQNHKRISMAPPGPGR